MRALFQSTTVLAAFIAGLVVGPTILRANAAPSPVISSTLTPQVIDLSAMTDAEIGPQAPHIGTLRSRFLVITPEATIAIQSGNVPKHFHLGSDEIQYIISGTGSFVLGNRKVGIHPGDLIIIPRGTAHAGSIATSGEFRTLAIKVPPQAAGDMHLLNQGTAP